MAVNSNRAREFSNSIEGAGMKRPPVLFGGDWAWSRWWDEPVGTSVGIPGFGVVTKEGESDGGSDGDAVWMVFKVQPDGADTYYARKTGWADSYGDYDWDGMVVEVNQEVVSVTKWT